MAIHSSGRTIFSFTHIEEITLGAGEEVEEVSGGAVVFIDLGKVHSSGCISTRNFPISL